MLNFLYAERESPRLLPPPFHSALRGIDWQMLLTGQSPAGKSGVGFTFQTLREIGKFFANGPVWTIFKKILLYLFLDRGKGREQEGEKHQCMVAPHVPPTGDLACNPGMYHDWELNQ